VNVNPAIVIVPTRCAPVLPWNVQPTLPLPGPAPDVTLIHAALLVAFHGQDAAVVTPTDVPVPAEAETVSADEDKEYAHALWFTVCVCPSITTVPLRAPALLPAMLKPTLPEPVPLAPDVTVIHESLLVAVQAQWLAVVTAIGVAAPPALPTDWFGGAMV
jgi:hypothetical protein